MRRRRTRPFIKPSTTTGGLALPLRVLGAPVEAALTQALRSAGRRRPSAFARLGPHRGSCFRLQAAGAPVAFEITPDPRSGAVRIVEAGGESAAVATVVAPMADLLALFDGSLDADAAFFSRAITVEGDIGAVMALHNALESAELGLADLLPLPFGRSRLNRLLGRMLAEARRRTAAAGT